MKKKPKIVVVVGPTSSGKTSLAIRIAQKFDGEVISADSRQVYKGLDLGTGKVTKDEMQGVPHHLLDVVDPKEVYTVVDYVRDAREAIKDILKRGKLPIIAGGTFFYIDALIGKLATPEVPPNNELRESLEAMSTEALYEALLKSDERRALNIDPGNKRRLIRALEIIEALGKVPEETSNIFYDTHTVGIEIEKSTLEENIVKRLDERLKLGMLDEVRALVKTGLTYERLEELGIEYKYLGRFLQKIITEDEMREEITNKSKQFAKRQMTWLKRDKSILWHSPTDDGPIYSEIENFLSD